MVCSASPRHSWWPVRGRFLSWWKVDDTATDRFYRNRLGKRDKAAPMGKAADLSVAKNWLRNLTLEAATASLGAVTQGVVRGEKTGVQIVGDIPKPTVKEGKPFAHPRYWAAFILIGDPD